MLPDLVIDSLRRYSAEKATLLDWFTTTAEKRRGFTISTKPSVEELVRLARRIVQATDPSIPVPARVLRSLTETIDLRKRCNAWYEEQGVTDLALRESNRTHRHFFSKLEEILNILTQGHVDEPQISEAQHEDEKDIPNQDSFDATDIGPLDRTDEPDSVNPERQDAPRQPSEAMLQSTAAQPTISYEMEDSDGGLQFKVFCLQTDLHAIRQFLSERLRRFKDGEISLMRVSVIINAAIGFARRLEKDFLDTFPSFTSWEQVVEATLPDIAHLEKAPFEELEPSQMERLGNSLFLPFHQLRRFRHSVHTRNELPSYPLGAIPFMDGGDGPSVQDSWRYDSVILNELFREIVSLRYDENLPVHDELVTGLKETLETRNVHLWVVFGLQLFLDTQHIIGKDVTRGFRELESTGIVCKKLNERHITLAQVGLKKKFSESEKETFRHDVSLVNKWISQDEFRTARQRMERPLGRPFFFLLHSPVTCGLFQSALLLRFQQRGMANANATEYISGVAHLYNAAKNEHLLGELWPDMEEIISLHGPDDIFLGQPPRNSAQYLSSYLIVRGFSAQVFAKGRVTQGAKHSTRVRRSLKSSELMISFERLLCQKDPSDSDITVEYIEKLLHKIARSQKARDLRRQWGTTKSLDSVQLLMLLEECIAAEEPKLKFNYGALNEQCFLLLATIEMSMKGMFARWVSESTGPILNMNRYQHLLPMFVFCRDVDNIILSMVGQTMGDFIRRRCEVPSEKVNGVVSDESWDESDEEHPTHNGDCLHWGVCDKDKAEVEKPDQTPAPGSHVGSPED